MIKGTVKTKIINDLNLNLIIKTVLKIWVGPLQEKVQRLNTSKTKVLQIEVTCNQARNPNNRDKKDKAILTAKLKNCWIVLLRAKVNFSKGKRDILTINEKRLNITFYFYRLDKLFLISSTYI